MDFIKMLILIISGYFIINFILVYRQMMKQQQEEFEKVQEEKEKYTTIDAVVFDSIEDENLKMAIVYHIWNKEDEDFEHLFENLTQGEKVIYTIFLVESALENGRNTFANFFTIANEDYYPLLVDSYQQVGCTKVIPTLEKVMEYQVAIENGEDLFEVDIEETADDLEPLPSYELYTLDYMDAIQEEEIDQKIIDYIRQNKEEFIN